MVAVVLFLNTIMAEVTSCKYRYIGFEWLLTEIFGVKIVYYVPAFLSIIGTENI